MSVTSVVKGLLNQAYAYGGYYSSVLEAISYKAPYETIQSMLEETKHKQGLNKEFTPSGKGALHMALMDQCDPRIIQLLLESGASVEHKDNDGSTPLHYAQTCKIIVLLVSHGASPNLSGSTTSPLMKILREGSLDDITLLLKKGADANAAEPLRWAVIRRNIDLARLLLAHGAQADIQDGRRKPLLQIAAELDDMDMVSLLLNHGATPITENNFPLLMRLLSSGKDALIELFLQKVGNVSAADSDGKTPLQWAIEKKKIDLAQLLIGNGADLNVEGVKSSDLCRMLRLARIDIVQRLLEAGAHVDARDEQGQTPLHWAVYHKNIDLVLLLLSYGAAIDTLTTLGISPLHIAVAQNNYKMISLLVDHGAKLNLEDTDLWLTLLLSREEVLDLLLQQGALAGDVDVALQWAINQKRMDLTKKLVLHGANPNLKDVKVPLLMQVVCLGDIDFTQLLLQKGADVNAVNEHGVTALYSAVNKEMMSLVELLIQFKASVNVGTKGGIVLRRAAAWGNIDVVRLLLQNGAQVNDATDHGETALHYAVNKKHKECALLLLNAGANPNSVINQTIAPLHLAIQNGDSEMMTMLLKSGADAHLANDEGIIPLFMTLKGDNTNKQNCFNQILEATHKINSYALEVFISGKFSASQLSFLDEKLPIIRAKYKIFWRDPAHVFPGAVFKTILQYAGVRAKSPIVNKSWQQVYNVIPGFRFQAYLSYPDIRAVLQTIHREKPELYSNATTPEAQIEVLMRQLVTDVLERGKSPKQLNELFHVLALGISADNIQKQAQNCTIV